MSRSAKCYTTELCRGQPRTWRSFQLLYPVSLFASQKYSTHNTRSQLQRSGVVWGIIYCHIWPRWLLYDAERDLLAMVKFFCVKRTRLWLYLFSAVHTARLRLFAKCQSSCLWSSLTSRSAGQCWNFWTLTVDLILKLILVLYYIMLTCKRIHYILTNSGVRVTSFYLV